MAARKALAEAEATEAAALVALWRAQVARVPHEAERRALAAASRRVRTRRARACRARRPSARP